MKTVVFRTDGSSKIGSGHIVRCITLAKLLASENWTIEFACEKSSLNLVNNLILNEDYAISILNGDDFQQFTQLKLTHKEGINLLVVDSYAIDEKFEGLCRPWAKIIMAIDDLANRNHDVDILLDQTFGRKSTDYNSLVPERCKTLIGANYALLRSEFSFYREKTLSKRLINFKVDKVLVTLGSSDPENITLTVLKMISRLKIDINTVVVLGANAPYLEIVRNFIKRSSKIKLLVDATDMAKIMAESDFAIGAGGVTSLERCCLGLPSITIVTANNQSLLAKNLFINKSQNTIDFDNRADSIKITSEIKRIYEDVELRKTMSIQGSKVCDGRGALRVLEVIEEICN